MCVPPETPAVVEDHLDELELLARTLGIEVVGRVVQERARIDPATYLGRGKAEELRDEAEAAGAQLVLCDVELSPAQLRNLEEVLKGARVMERAAVILEIFHRHARSREAKTQVELAELRYLLPRLRRRWTHLDRQRGGVGLRGGEGETQLEVDRRMVSRRIEKLEGELDGIARQRQVRARGREESYKVALLGYTNAGKSSLMNAVTEAGVLVEDQLFSTLDSTIRAWTPEECDGRRILFIDTVGFIRKLPVQLVASFRSTLEEATDADLLVVVADVGSPVMEEHLQTTEEILREVGADEKPRVMVFNKTDRLENSSLRERLARNHPNAVFTSARTGEGLEDFRDAILASFRAHHKEEVFTLPNSDGRLLSRVYEEADVLEAEYEDGVVRLRVRGKPEELARIRRMAEAAS